MMAIAMLVDRHFNVVQGKDQVTCNEKSAHSHSGTLREIVRLGWIFPVATHSLIIMVVLMRIQIFKVRLKDGFRPHSPRFSIIFSLIFPPFSLETEQRELDSTFPALPLV